MDSSRCFFRVLFHIPPGNYSLFALRRHRVTRRGEIFQSGVRHPRDTYGIDGWSITHSVIPCHLYVWSYAWTVHFAFNVIPLSYPYRHWSFLHGRATISKSSSNNTFTSCVIHIIQFHVLIKTKRILATTDPSPPPLPSVFGSTTDIAPRASRCHLPLVRTLPPDLTSFLQECGDTFHHHFALPLPFNRPRSFFSSEFLKACF